MKLAVISDLHLGDPTCTLVARNARGSWATRAGYDVLRDAIRNRLGAGSRLDLLVLLGDVLDFSIASQSEAYAAASVFFRAVKDDDLTAEILYVPGNHDFSAWSLTMQHANVIKPIQEDREVKDRWSVPAIIDSRVETPSLHLSGVSKTADGGYGGLFFDALAGLPVSVAYPNLYVIDRAGQTTLVTHGQYFEAYWSLAWNIARHVFGPDLRLVAGEGRPSIDELVAINFPLNDLASSGLGQAGPLTPIVRRIQAHVKSNDFATIKTYLRRARDYADDLIAVEGFGKRIRELLSDLAIESTVNSIAKSLAGGATISAAARYDERFLDSGEVRSNAVRFLDACALEIEAIEAHDALVVPKPSTVLFGHTHCPIPFAAPRPPHLAWPDGNHTVTFLNTGGWLARDLAHPAEAAIFFYDDASDSPWSSVEVSTNGERG